MTSLRPASGPIPKPTKRAKKPAKPMARGGRKPKEAGRRYEHSFAEKYEALSEDIPGVSYRRQVGSGAFSTEDPTLAGDVVAEIHTLRLLFEAKSWHQINGRGEKTVTFPVNLLDKISKEAKLLQREPIFVYHVKGASNEWAVVEYEWLHDLIVRWESTVEALMTENEDLRSEKDYWQEQALANE